MVNLFDIVDIGQYNSGSIGRGRTDYNIAASENLLDQSLCIADALDLFVQQRLFKTVQDSSFAGYAEIGNDIELVCR